MARLVGHSRKVTAPTQCAFSPPSAIRRTAPITRSEARYRSCGRSGPKSPVRGNRSFDGDPTPLLRATILSPSRAVEPVSNCRGTLSSCRWVGMGWASPAVPPGSRRQTSNRSGPGGPLGASHLGQRLCGQRLCGQRRTPLPEIRVPDVGTPVTAVRAMPAHGRGIPVSSVGLRPADGLRFPARPGDCPGFVEEANATNGVGQVPRVIKCRRERSARIVC